MSVRDSLIFTGLIFLIFGVFLFIAMDDKGLLHMMDQSRTLTHIREENRRVEEVNAELGRSIERLRNDLDYVESLARRDLGMVGKEEMVLRFKKDLQDTATAAASAVTASTTPGASSVAGTTASGASSVAAKPEPEPSPAAAKAKPGASKAAAKAKPKSSRAAAKTKPRPSPATAKAKPGDALTPKKTGYVPGTAWTPRKTKSQAAETPKKIDSGIVWSPRKGKLDTVASPEAAKAAPPPNP